MIISKKRIQFLEKSAENVSLGAPSLSRIPGVK
jgi:hypothetical protein